jgi:hypothetical protein
MKAHFHVSSNELQAMEREELEDHWRLSPDLRSRVLPLQSPQMYSFCRPCLGTHLIEHMSTGQSVEVRQGGHEAART